MKKSVTRLCGGIRSGMATVLAVILCLQVGGSNVYASENMETVSTPEIRSVNLNINGSIAGIHDPSEPKDENSEWSNGDGSHVRYGNMWFNVLDNDADDFTEDSSKSLFLWSENLFTTMKFNQNTDNSTPGKNEWENSDIRTYLNGTVLEDNFNSIEQTAIIDSYNDSHSSWERLSQFWQPADLNGDKLFLLDAVEATSGKYGFMETMERSASRAHDGKFWWLRSCATDNTYEAGCVAPSGMVAVINASVKSTAYYCSAAMNLSLDKVFFTVAQNSRPYVFSETADKTAENRWIITIYDDNMDFDAEMLSDTVIRNERTVKVKINSIGEASEGVSYNQITGMLVDEAGTVISCGKIGNITDEEIDVALPMGIADGRYTLKVFAEHTYVSGTTTYASHEADLHFRVSSKKEYPDELPEEVIIFGNDVKSVGDVELPTGWAWDEEASDGRLIQGGTVTATAIYTGEDAAEYENTSVDIEVTRAACVEGEEILFTREDDIEPDCTHSGYGHTVCTICGDTLRTCVEVDPVGHTWEADYTVDNEPSCIEEGSRSIHCSVCGARNDSCSIDKLEHEPSDTVIENKMDATCCEEGAFDEVIYCKQCGEEISREHKVIERKAHIPSEPVSENRIDPSCTDKGNYDEVVYCADCGIELSRIQVFLDEAGHEPGQMTVENRIDPTCTSEGSFDEVVYCKDCGAEISRTHKTIDICGHNPGEAITENETESTCREHGHYDETVYCTECGEELGRHTFEKELKSHSAGEIVIENRVAASCSSMGGYDEVSCCAECGIELSRKHIDIEKIAHNPAEKVIENRNEATCRSEGSYDEVVYCRDCGYEMERVHKLIDKKEHTEGEAVRENVINATAVEDGSYEEVVYCLDCKEELSRKTVTIPRTEDETGNTPDDHGDNGDLENNSSDTQGNANSEEGNHSDTNGNNAGTSSSDQTSQSSAQDNNTGSDSGDSSQPSENADSSNGTDTPSDQGNGDNNNAPDIAQDNGNHASGSTSAPASTADGAGNSGSSSYSGFSGGSSASSSTGDTDNHSDESSNTSSDSENTVSEPSSQPDTVTNPTDDSPSDNQGNTNDAGTGNEGNTTDLPIKGDVIQDTSNGFEYKVSKTGKSATVLFNGMADSKKTSVKIPATVRIDGVSYKVTGIAAGAFKNNRNLKKITVGKNITTVGKNAFNGCKKLKTVIIRSRNIKKIGTCAFAGINKKAVIKVPMKSLRKYKKLLKKAKLSKKVKIKAY